MNKRSEDQDSCTKCSGPGNIPLRTEVQTLKQRLIDRNITIVQMEATMAQELPHIYSQGQLASLRVTCDNWQDKYERLLEAHKRLQKVNQGLEDKLLRLVDRSESEKARLTQDSSNLTTALTTAAQAINRLKNENARYQKDLSLAIQFLQCNPSHYASHKLDMLPSEFHQKAKARLGPEPPKTPRTEAKIIRVPIPTFPPTAVVYSVNKCIDEGNDKEEPVDVVSAAILAAILEERERERSKKHCPTCTCKMPNSKSNPTEANKSEHSNFPPAFSRTEENVEGKANNVSRGNNSSFSSNFSTFDVNAIDVGTQTVPSYIGETGKVTSTCIYCQSSKTLSEISIHSVDSISDSILSNNSSAARQMGHGNNSSKIHQHSDLKNSSHKTEMKGNVHHVACPWDWHAESQDSGSPPTPTSLTSASLSYESETSCFTSPQDSPGHVSLHSINESVRNQEMSPSVKTNKLIPVNDHSKLTEESIPLLSPEQPLSEKPTPVLWENNIFQRPTTYQRLYKGSPKTLSSESRLDKYTYVTNPSTPYRIPFNAFLPDQDVFTTPIHVSPTGRHHSNSSNEINGWNISPTDSLTCNDNSKKKSFNFNNTAQYSNCDLDNFQNSSILVTKNNKSKGNLINNISCDDKTYMKGAMEKNVLRNSVDLNGFSSIEIDPVIISSTQTRSATETTL